MHARYNLRSREEESVHNHHRKIIFWRTFLASKKNFPGRWWIQKPYKNQENHIHHRNLSSVDPIFFCKEKFCTGAGRCMLSFSQRRIREGASAPFWRVQPLGRVPNLKLERIEVCVGSVSHSLQGRVKG